jgi:DNA-binding transcriptional ArsR family regulator
MEAALTALAEPHRREILRLVQDKEMPAGQIAAHFDISRPAISQHLHVLLDAGLVTERREGTRHLYRLRPAGFEDIARFVGLFWDVNLERLKAEAERQEQALRADEGRAQEHRTR